MKNSCQNKCSQKSVSKRFENMIQNCYEYATKAKQNGGKIVGIMCEYTPRELILAAGAIPICLCGGSAEKVTAAEKDLPFGLCPLIKSTYGYFCTKSNPFLEMADLIVAETTCDGKKKMYEIMSRGKKMYVLELPQKPDDADAFKHWQSELKKFKSFLEDFFSTLITNDDLRRAILTMNTERELRRALAEHMKKSSPVWKGRQLLDFKSIISGIEDDFSEYRRLNEYARNCRGCGNGAVRVLLTGVPTVHGAEKVVDIIEQAGAVIVCMENCTGLKPILEDVEAGAGDPLKAIAEKYFHLPCSVMTPNQKRLDSLNRFIDEYKPDCVIELVWQGCLTYDVESYFVKELADSHNLAYLKIQTDYSPSDSARIRLRVEALVETAGQK